MKAPGRLIVLEGIDGTGKTTLARALAEALRTRGRTVVVSCEPTHGPIGRQIRQLATAGRVPVAEEIELFLRDRAEHQQAVIRPALAAGQDVILDRYYFSSIAYQGARGGNVAEIERRNRAIARPPDLLVLLDLPVDAALARITQQRGATPDLFEGRDYLARVEQIFAAMDYPYQLRLDARQPTAELVARILERLTLEGSAETC